MNKEEIYDYNNLFLEKKSDYKILPIMALVFLVPIIVRLAVIELNEEVYKYWIGETVVGELFSFPKMELTIILSAIIFLALGIKYFDSKFNISAEKKYIKYVAIYCIFITLSCIFTDYRIIIREGFVGKNESVWILFAYMIVLLATIKLIESEKSIKLVMWSISLGAFIVGIVGLTQVFKHDFWKTNLGQALLIPARYKEMLTNGVSITMAEGTAYGTLNNTNYMGSYALLIIPITIALYIITKNKIAKVFLIGISLIMIANLFGSNSRAGIVGAALAILAFILVVGIKMFTKNKKFMIAMISLALIVAIGSYFVIPEKINPIKRIIADLNSHDDLTTVREWLKDIKVEGDTAKLITADNELHIVSDESDVYFTDAEGNKLVTYANDEGVSSFIDSRYEAYNVAKFTNNKEEELLLVQVNNIEFALNNKVQFYFNIAYKNEIFLSDVKGYKIPSLEADSIGFDGREKLGSARGYIWSRTLPLLKNSMLWGYGPDTYAAVFPQHDLKGKLIAYGDPGMLVDKPHNYYLEVAMNTGVCSLIALLLIFGTYLWSSLKIFRKLDLKSNYHIIALGIFTAVVGYLGAAFFNDSIIAVAVVFWTVLGLGIAVNYIINKEAVE